MPRVACKVARGAAPSASLCAAGARRGRKGAPSRLCCARPLSTRPAPPRPRAASPPNLVATHALHPTQRAPPRPHLLVRRAPHLQADQRLAAAACSAALRARAAALHSRVPRAPREARARREGGAVRSAAPGPGRGCCASTSVRRARLLDTANCWTVHMLTRLSSGARCAIAERAWCSRGGEGGGGGVPGGWAAGRHGEGDQGSRGRGAAQEGQGAGGRCVARSLARSLARSRHVRADTWPSSGASGRERRQGRGAGVCGLREALGQAMQQVQGRLLLRRQVPGTTGTSHAAAQRSLRVPTPRHADA